MVELQGLKGWGAYQAYLKVVFFVPLTKRYLGDDEAIQKFKKLDDGEKNRILTECLSVAPLDDSDTLRLLAVHKDANGISYSKVNVSNLQPDKALELVTATMVACSHLGDDLFF